MMSFTFDYLTISLTIITLIAILLIVYHHLGYPLLLTFIAKRNANKQTQTTNLNTRQFQQTAIDASLPRIAIIMPAYNEASMIADKLRNLACLDYPQDKLEVIVGCDGCNDNTVAVARSVLKEPLMQGMNINIRVFSHNRGKVAMLNELIPQANCDIIALSDISALLSINALLSAAEQFKNPQIGVITGHYQFLNSGSEGEQKYWRYQSQVKANEAKLGSTIGVHGAFYLFRKKLFKPLAADTINDDFVLPMEIVAQGYRADFSNQINAIELETVAINTDHKRRRRIAAGNIQQLWRLKSLLNPKHRGVAFNFASGKALRSVMPFILVVALIGSGVLGSGVLGSGLLSTTHWLFNLVFWGQITMYSLGLLTLLLPSEKRPKGLATLAYIISGYSASLVGAMRYLAGLEKGRWQRVEH